MASPKARPGGVPPLTALLLLSAASVATIVFGRSRAFEWDGGGGPQDRPKAAFDGVEMQFEENLPELARGAQTEVGGRRDL
jgi:hypothetical protein